MKRKWFRTNVSSEGMYELLDEFLNIRYLYNAALKEIETKFRILDDEFHVKYSHNPVHGIESRLKDTMSIKKKLEKKGLPLNIKTSMKNLNDIAGIRVICNYIDDVYIMSDLILKQDDITLICKKDYIQKPKCNGYRSLHLVVTVPIFLANTTEIIPVEIQIRTIAMDFWASLEHEIKYKSEITEKEKQISQNLTVCAGKIADLDIEMQQIHKGIQNDG